MLLYLLREEALFSLPDFVRECAYEYGSGFCREDFRVLAVDSGLFSETHTLSLNYYSRVLSRIWISKSEFYMLDEQTL